MTTDRFRHDRFVHRSPWLIEGVERGEGEGEAKNEEQHLRNTVSHAADARIGSIFWNQR